MVQEGGPEVQWTTMARTQYQRLFKSVRAAPPATLDGGPASIPEPTDENKSIPTDPMQVVDRHHAQPLAFVFAPDIGSLINPTPATLVRFLPSSGLQYATNAS